ncbi:hypothetical protein LEAN103870_04455 [Legionella anisa]|uniref:Uncharacterized protein n=1 Tax=Legionella anisa TaxID=28082 RepID=A0AAX0WXE2_9GAMM|nr:hypothetical protein [Legionella anisa]AWN72892.1 hypothetical protein DLD14_03015 [Legionella anisa]KTC70656.1 hypothetical protein Lani_2203 [Legionella anisa]MBN5936485.1 hypothetical protein [Legionella anisa]MCW8423701.1 hypothetical protein [Legionella anisa]MCW8447221.1 hypothetical protein [Legionella anisa]
MKSKQVMGTLFLKEKRQRLGQLINIAYQKAQNSTPTNLYERIQVNDAIKQMPELLKCLDNRRKLEQFLATRWQNIKRRAYLSYTSAPDSPMTKICCDVANYLADPLQRRSSHRVFPALKYLMPSVNRSSDGTYSYIEMNSYEDISKLALKDIVKFYIVITNDNDEDWLTPVSLLKHIEVSTSEELVAKILVNPFTGKCLSQMDIERLTHHSETTEVLMKSYYRFHSLSKKSSSLYSAIEYLIEGLKEGGEHALIHGGVSDSAGVKAYLALELFRNYWEKLSSEQQKKARGNRELNRALNKAILNPNWSDSCVETLAECLMRALADDKGELTSICLDNTKMDSLLVTCKQDFDLYKKSLEDAFDKRVKYDGREILPLSPSQVMEIDKNSIQNSQDVLIIFKDLDREGFSIFCTQFEETIAESIRDVDGLAEVLIGLNEQLIIILTQIMAYRFTKLLNHDEFIALINFLNEERANAFLQGLGISLWNFIIFKDEEFMRFSPSKRIIVWNNIHKELLTLPTSVTSIEEIAKVLSPQQIGIYFNNVKNKLSTAPIDCCLILRILPKEHQKAYLDVIWPNLIKLVANMTQFTMLLSVIKGKNKAEYLNKMESRLVDITQTHEELEKIFLLLPKDKKERYLKDMKENKEQVFNEYMRLICCNFIGKIKLPRIAQSGLLEEIKRVPSFTIEFFKEKISNQDKSYFNWFKETTNYLLSNSINLTFFNSNKPNRLEDCFYQVLDDNPDEFLAIRLFVFNMEPTNSQGYTLQY